MVLLLALNPACSSAIIPLEFKSVQDVYQHKLVRMTDEADGFVVLTELYVALYREDNSSHRLR